MKKVILDNGIVLIYEYRPSELTSFCIGFNAGALEEKDKFNWGTAHVVEHMISKGTKKRSEKVINELCDRIFGFENAMTNFSYVVYYGTCLSQNFKSGFEVYSDILLNPLFSEVGFSEEMNVISQELKEWKENIYQYCEDLALYNAFLKKRIRIPIIGEENSIRSITLDDIRKFYETYYAPQNCVISVCSSLKFEDVLDVVNKYIGSWKRDFSGINPCIYEKNKAGTFAQRLDGVKGAKIQYIFSIDDLNLKEFKNLNLFNTAFGDGLSSILFDEIRTNYGLAYDVASRINYDRGSKFFTITMGTSSQNVEMALKLTNSKIEQIKNDDKFFIREKISYLNDRIKLKKQLRLEKAIQLCKDLTCCELMYNSAELVYKQTQGLDKVNSCQILETINKVLNGAAVQIIFTPGV
ncbi:pitrilysin family protein [Clostridium sp. JN-1]|uniref:M16 family metallopeptidase n=1 Tax=Clostridium sp. JN-1 TaxID=2483110 RepID=UPI000F0B1C94|nr:pitrilysin family protein [Clostridium sp. JN-1]